MSEDSDGRWSFEIGEVLDLVAKGRFGRGGMGEVYRAEYAAPLMEEPVQVCALKVLLPDADAHRQRIFRDEVRLLSLLRHESIARYHQSFVHKGRLVLVMEYVEGRSLHSILGLARSKCWLLPESRRLLPESISVELVAQVAEALDYAHQAKDAQGRPLHIVHRDISPSNILITRAGVPKVVDFGIAKADRDGQPPTLTDGNPIKGKVPYLSPEQVEHEPLDGRSELWSLCCVLVEMLRAEPPFGPFWHEVTLRAISEVTPRDVDLATRGLSEKVRAICQKALARDPAQRFATGHEMAQALLAEHECRGPSAVREYIAALEALPDMSREDMEALAAHLRRNKRIRRAVVAIGGLAVTAVFSWSVVRGVSRSTLPASAAPPPVAAAPLEQLITPVPAQGHDVVVTPSSGPAPGKHFAPPAIVATKKARIPRTVTAPPTESRGDGAVSLSDDSDKSMGPLRDELVTAKTSSEVVAAKYVKVSGEALSPQHALATLFATDNGDHTDFQEVSSRRLTVNGVDVYSTVWMSDDSGTVAVVVDLPNPNDAMPWEPLEGRIISERSSSESQVALRAMPRVIPPGQRGRVALVFNRSVIEDKAMVEILRDSRPDFGIEVTSQELAQHNSLWRSLWHFGER